MANITKRKDSYLIRVSAGFDGTGKRLHKCLTWKPPADMSPKQADKEAAHQAALFEERCRTGQILESNTRFSDFVEIWLKDHAEKQLRPTTLAGYRDMLRRILAAFGNTKINAIQPHHLNAFYDNLAEGGVRADIKYSPRINFKELLAKKKLTQVKLADMAEVNVKTVKNCVDGKNINADSAKKISEALGKKLSDLFALQKDKGLSSKTVLHYHRLISSILTTAVQWQVIFANPCDRVKPPKVVKKEAKYLDEIQAVELISALDSEPFQYQVMIHVLLYMGLRRGELCGLEWQDVDYFTNCLHIRRSSLYLAEKGVFEDSTKTDDSKRSIKMPDNIITLLKQYKSWQDDWRNEVGLKWQECGRLFTTDVGKPIHPDTITGWFKDFVKRKNLPDISVHGLRHTSATLQIMSGIPIKTVSSRLGHASSVTTSMIYSHAIKSMDEAAAEVLQNILTPKENVKIKPLKTGT
jgi:integrase